MVLSDINLITSCVKADPFLINRPSFQCETHPRNERSYVNGCCKTNFCSSNLTLDTSKMFDDEGKGCSLSPVFSFSFSLSVLCNPVLCLY